VHAQNTGSVVAHSRGGLGNQLFILAAGIDFALRENKKLSIDSSLNSIPGGRPFRAADFLDSDLVPIELIDSVWPRWKLALQNLGLFSFCEVTEDNYFTKNQGCIWGYFQSQEFHKSYSAEIYRSFSKSLDSLVNEKSMSIPPRNSITVHIRRGDYASGSAAKVHGCIDYDYYERILKSEDGPIFIVSEDSDSLTTLRKKLPGREIKQFRGRSEFDDLYFLSKSHRLVIANSSFSWWGATLGDQDKTVYSPRNWYRSGKTTRYPIHLPSWIQVETSFEEL
jgi:hypothetical protein